MGLANLHATGDDEHEWTPAEHGQSADAVPGVHSRKFNFETGEFLVLSFPLRHAAGLRLSRAESEIALAILAGASNQDIARQRGRSARTIANQVASLFRKLCVRSRQELAVALAGARNTTPRPGDGRLRLFALLVSRRGGHARAGNDLAQLAAGAWRVIDLFDAGERRYIVARPTPEPLAPREQHIILRRARGDSVKEIAIDLGLSAATVSRRLSKAMQKIGLASHSELPRLFAGLAA